MLYNLETKTQKLKHSHIIENVRGEANGRILTLHLNPRNFYKKNLTIEPGCKVTCNNQEFQIVDYRFSEKTHHYLILTLDSVIPGENYSILNCGLNGFCVAGHLEGNKLVIFTVQRKHRNANFKDSLIIGNSRFYRCSAVDSEPKTHFLVLTVKEAIS